MSFDLQKAQDIKQGLFAVTDSIVEHYEYRAVKMFPDAVDEIERLQKCCMLAPDGKIFVPDGHPELERLREENEKQAKRLAELEKALVEERAKVLYFAHAGDGMYDMDVLEEADHHKTRHLQEADEQLRREGAL